MTHTIAIFIFFSFFFHSMSLGGGAMQSLDDAVRAAIYRGIHFAVAAGNDGADACYGSPARMPEA